MAKDLSDHAPDPVPAAVDVSGLKPLNLDLPEQYKANYHGPAMMGERFRAAPPDFAASSAPVSPVAAAFNAAGQPKPLSRDVSVILPVSSYHFDTNLNHVAGFNESNPGIGVKWQLSPTTAITAIDYKNSYANTKQFSGDHTQLVGVQYSPEIAQVDVSGLHLSAGVLAGVATTNKGSYAKMMPDVSNQRLNLTPVAALTAGVEHKASGWGVQAMVVPPPPSIGAAKPVGFAGFALTKKLSF